MFPLAIIAGAIGAVVSVAQGASWVQDHVASSGNASSVGGKSDTQSQSSANASSSFEATLAAQVTGQSVPTSASATTNAASSASSVLTQTTTAYDTLERTKAGIAAYSQHGEHRSGGATDSPVTRS